MNSMLEVCSDMFLDFQNIKRVIYGLGYKLTLTGKKDESVLD